MRQYHSFTQVPSSCLMPGMLRGASQGHTVGRLKIPKSSSQRDGSAIEVYTLYTGLQGGPPRGGASPGVSDSDSFQSHLSQSCAGFCTGRQRLSPKERSRVGMLCVCQERDVLQMRKPRTEGVWGPHRFKISSDSLFARKSRSH